MSEAMTNPEIEDVLASIRRLVAQDRRPRPERLILTEEFRVRQANIPAPPQPAVAPVLTLQPPPPPPPAALEVGAPALLARVVAETVRAAPPPAAPPEAAAEPAPAAAFVSDAAALEASLRDLEAAIPGPAPTSTPAPAGEPLQPQPDPQPQPQPQAEIVGDDVAFIDEDDLERMVARIVREELRGQLGERITLQVRKLVRAEIARALDERNLLG